METAVSGAVREDSYVEELPEMTEEEYLEANGNGDECMVVDLQENEFGDIIIVSKDGHVFASGQAVGEPAEHDGPEMAFSADCHSDQKIDIVYLPVYEDANGEVVVTRECDVESCEPQVKQECHHDGYEQVVTRECDVESYEPQVKQECHHDGYEPEAKRECDAESYEPEAKRECDAESYEPEAKRECDAESYEPEVKQECHDDSYDRVEDRLMYSQHKPARSKRAAELSARPSLLRRVAPRPHVVRHPDSLARLDKPWLGGDFGLPSGISSVTTIHMASGAVGAAQPAQAEAAAVRPHKCGYCDQAYREATSLSLHVTQFHKVVPDSCAVS